MQPAAANHPPTAGPGLGVLGGTFDPPHQSHVRLARAALAHLPIQELLVIPAGDHPHKQGRGTSPAAHRLAMCELAFADVVGARVDDREVRRAGLSFTVDTLAELRSQQPARQLFFLIGSDNLRLLPTWRDHHRILRLATVVTYPRAGFAVGPEALAGLDLDAAERQTLLRHQLPLPADAVSSTAIRATLARGEVCPDVAPAVAAYAARHHLYRR